MVTRPISIPLVALLALAGAAPADASPDAESTEERPIRRLRPARNMIELGVSAGAFVFSRGHDFYDPATAPQEPLRRVSPDFGVRAAFFPLSFFGIEAEFAALPAKYEPGGRAFIYGVRGHGILQLPLFRVVPFIVGGYGAMGVRSDPAVAGNDIDPVGHYGAGVKYFVNRWLALRLDIRHVIAAQAAHQVNGTSHLEVLAGLSLTLGRGNGSTPAPNGAPPDRDRDHDGFVNSEDRCPEEPGVAPDGCPDRDADGDAILDSVDACPAVPGVAPTGCPPADRDRDGILDEDDQCPDQPGVAPEGCPIGDRDNDAILDPDDACPDEPETRNGFQDRDGCPDVLPPEVETHTGVIRGIFFDFNRDTIRDRSRPTLDAAIKVLQEYPEVHIEIVGHSDDVGKRDYNVDLSRKRAEAVRTYMIDHGVAAERLTTRGAGPDEPMADNSNARGRAENRRIEFKIVPQ